MAAPLASLAFELFASLLAPPRCAACDAPVALLAAFCPPCARTVVRAHVDDSLGDSAVVAGFAYGGAVARAISRFKYERRPDLARPLGDLLWRAVEPLAPTLGGSSSYRCPFTGHGWPSAATTRLRCWRTASRAGSVRPRCRWRSPASATRRSRQSSTVPLD